MRFEEADLDGASRWRWFESKDLGVRVELYGPTTLEMNAFVDKYRFGLPGSDVPGMVKHIARKWWRGAEGFTKSDGTAHDMTPELKERLLSTFLELFGFVMESLKDLKAWRAEGNGGGGTD